MRYYIIFSLPVIGACIALTTGTNPDSDIWAILLLLLVEFVLYLLYKRLKNNATEFLSGYMCRIEHYFAWVERVVKEEYQRDANGNQSKVKVARYVNHPDEYVEVFNINHKQHVSAEEFNRVCKRWNTGLYSFQTNHKNCVKGGGGEACKWNGDENSTKTATIIHK